MERERERKRERECNFILPMRNAPNFGPRAVINGHCARDDELTGLKANDLVMQELSHKHTRTK